MARTIQQGMLYFNLDVDFLQDIKIRRILRACGPQSLSILIWLLSSIFRDEGYYVRWHEDMPFLIADDIGVNDGAVMETVKKSLQVGFFDPGMLEEYSILTSHGIQKRFFEMAKRRVYVNYDSRYLLIDISEYKNVKNVYKNGIHVNNNSINVYHNQQSKGKEGKVIPPRKNNIDEELAEIAQAYQNNIHPVLSEIEAQSLKEDLDHYGKDVVLKAITRAVKRGGKRLSYIEGILRSWEQNGYDEEVKSNGTRTNNRGNGTVCRQNGKDTIRSVREDWSSSPDDWDD